MVEVLTCHDAIFFMFLCMCMWGGLGVYDTTVTTVGTNLPVRLQMSRGFRPMTVYTDTL